MEELVEEEKEEEMESLEEEEEEENELFEEEEVENDGDDSFLCVEIFSRMKEEPV